MCRTIISEVVEAGFCGGAEHTVMTLIRLGERLAKEEELESIIKSSGWGKEALRHCINVKLEILKEAAKVKVMRQPRTVREFTELASMYIHVCCVFVCVCFARAYY